MHIPSSAPADVQQAFRDLYAIVAPLDQTRAIDWKTRRLSKLGDATEGTDAITKAQVDALIKALRSDAGLDVGTGPEGALAGLVGGVRVGTYAVRGAAPAHAGELFLASDRNYVGWVSTASAWKYVSGAQYGTLSPNQKPTLTTDDTGYLFASTDFARMFRWSGSAWTDAPGQPVRWAVSMFLVEYDPGAGWHKVDGTAGVPFSAADGTTGTVTLPDFITAKRMLRSNSASGTFGGSATTHTHAVDPPNTTSGGPSTANTGTPSATTNVQSGAGATVASDTHTHSLASHTHDTNIASFASGAPSGSSGDDALPPYYDCNPWVRL